MAGGSTAQRRAREKQERRDAILDAAEQVFGERGAHAATMDEVADAAEVSKGTLYLYFKSKDDLFLALTHRPLDAVLARFAQLKKDRRASGLALLEQLMNEHTAVLQAHGAQFRLAMASMCGGYEPDPAATSFDDYSARVREVRGVYIAAIERGIADGSMRADLAPGDVATAVWASLFGASFLRMNAPRLPARLRERTDLASYDRLVPTLIRLLLDSVRATSEEPRP